MDELRDELSGRYIETKGLSKVHMQKALIKALSLVAPVVRQSVLPRPVLSPQQQMELEVMKMQSEALKKQERMRAEALGKKERIEAEERKELREREREALERKERKEDEALEK